MQDSVYFILSEQKAVVTADKKVCGCHLTVVMLRSGTTSKLYSVVTFDKSSWILLSYLPRAALPL